MVLDGLPGKQSHEPAGDGMVGVYFPQAGGGETKARRATVAACFPKHDDDVVLLQLAGGPAPLGPEQIAVLGTAEESCWHPFRSYGYRRLGDYLAAWADGKIKACVPPPEGSPTQAEPVQLESSQINQGMSGAGVLDTERNLVVGIVSEVYFPGNSPKDRDTAWAVNARVLTFDPFNFPVRQESLPLRPAPQPKTDLAAARAAVAPDLGVAWNNAPPPLAGEWAGRADLLRDLTADWADPARRVTGLIGFGGEGKSSLARRWVETLLAADLSPAPFPERGGESASPFPLREGGQGVRSPDAVFWWGFYERPSVDQFFEAALAFLSGGRIDPSKVPSASVRAQIIGAMLGAGRYLFVLDGLEVLQHQEGDRYGLLKSADLRDLLTYFAAPGHPSFCLVTSRAPLLDLLDYPGYTHRDVERLSPADGRALLLNLGVRGSAAALDRVVADWDGHAMTLSLLGGYLAERHGGDVAHLGELPPPTAAEPRYARVGRVLRRYDEHLTEAERAFLALFSAFRAPVDESAFAPVFLPFLPPSPSGRGGGGEGETAAELVSLAQRLVAYRLLRRDPASNTYTAHPLVRAHYAARLAAAECAASPWECAASPWDPAAVRAAYARIKDYYLARAGDTPENPTLDDLKPLIEAVHHACCAREYDEAHRIRRERIDQVNRLVLIHQLGAQETYLRLALEFFPSDDATQEPLGNEDEKRWILNTVGLCLMSLGRLGEAVPFDERGNAIALGMEDWHNASIGYRNLAEMHAHLGALASSAEAAGQALDLGRRAEDKQDERISLAYQAWAAHLRGDLEAAGAAFVQAEALERDIYSNMNIRYLFSLRGIRHADALRRTGDADYARRVTQANLEICQQQHWPFLVSMCHRLLGDLDAAAGQHRQARAHYDAALKLARGISVRYVLVEALLARGRWAARYADPTGLEDPSALAFADLNEALGYALDGGYRIYEADIRVALAWAHLSAGNPSAARAEAERARQMSVEMGYHWGQVDAAEVLVALG
jgi:tetratricopeptide (TPR) repeat protein